MKKSNTDRGKQIIIFGLIWAITYIACLLFVRELELGKTLGIVLSFVPAIAFVLFLRFYILGIKSMDEVERAIQLEAVVISFSLSLLLLMVLGLLENVVVLKKEDWSYRHLVPYLFVFYFLGILISRRKYQGDEKLD